MTKESPEVNLLIQREGNSMIQQAAVDFKPRTGNYDNKDIRN